MTDLSLVRAPKESAKDSYRFKNILQLSLFSGCNLGTSFRVSEFQSGSISDDLSLTLASKESVKDSYRFKNILQLLNVI